jgi:hypothetical protein
MSIRKLFETSESAALDEMAAMQAGVQRLRGVDA